MSNVKYPPPGMRPHNRARKHGGAFSANDVRLIRRRVMEGASRLEVALSYCVSKETIDRVVTGQTYGWVPMEGMAPAGISAAELQQRADESFEKLQRMLAEQPKRPSLLEADSKSIAATAQRLREQPAAERPKVKRYHALLAEGWRYCEGVLTCPEDIELMGLVPDEDQSEKETTE